MIWLNKRLHSLDHGTMKKMPFCHKGAQRRNNNTTRGSGGGGGGVSDVKADQLDS